MPNVAAHLLAGASFYDKTSQASGRQNLISALGGVFFSARILGCETLWSKKS